MVAVLVLLITLLNQSGYCQNLSSIKVTEKEQFVTFIGEYQNNTVDTVQLKYSMVTTKSGKSGNSSQQQSGLFSALPHHSAQLGTSAINKQTGDQVIISLKIMDKNTVVDSTTLYYPEKK